MIAYPGEIQASRLVCRRRSPIVGLLPPWRFRLAQQCRGDIEIELLEAALKLRRIDRSDGRRDPEFAQIIDVGERDALQSRVVEQDLDRHRTAVAAGQPMSQDDVSRRREQSRCDAAIGAPVAVSGGAGWLVLALERLGRQLRPVGRQQRQLVVAWRSVRAEIGVIEVASVSLVPALQQ